MKPLCWKRIGMEVSNCNREDVVQWWEMGDGYFHSLYIILSSSASLFNTCCKPLSNFESAPDENT